MAEFIPKKGDLFYFETKSLVEEENDVVVLRQVKRLQKTTHYYGSSAINKCLAVDARIIVYVVVANLNNTESVGEKRSVVKSRQIYFPVGPEVKEALGLLEGVDETNPLLMKT